MRSSLLFLAASLAVSIPTFAAEPKDYLPIQIGSEWTSTAAFVAPSGNKTTGTGQRKIAEKVELDGKTYYRTRTKLEGGASLVEYSKLIRKDAAGLYSLPDGVAGAKEQLEIPMPLTAGQTWQTVAGTVTITSTMVGVETVTVGKKIYKECLHIRVASADKSYQEDYWEAPVVGTVKSEIVSTTMGKITLTLRDYKVGK